MFMNIKMNKKLAFILLVAIVVLSVAARFYKLDSAIPSLNWDESAVGYNAYSIAEFGVDEWGKSFPTVFKSFEDDKHPVHVYLTALSVKILGLSDFSVRFPAALFGVLNVVVIFFLAKLLFDRFLAGLIASFFLAISPYGIHFSHFNHEFNFVIFFFMLGLFCFLKAIKYKKHILIPISFASFGVTLLAYHSAKVVVPPMVMLLLVLYFKDLWKVKKYFFSGIIVLSAFVLIIIFNPALTGMARVNQTSFSSEEVQKTDFYQKTGSELLGRVEITYKQYLFHFTPWYLFETGDKNSRLSPQLTGEFFRIDFVFLLFGVIYLIWKRSKASLIIFSWALLAPIPSSLVNEAPHAARAMFMLGSWHLIAAAGFFSLLEVLKIRNLKIVAGVLVVALYIFYFKNFITSYFEDYGKRYAIEWQYGIKQVAEYVQAHPEYYLVYMTDIRSQPYIFFLYNLKTPVSDFLKDVDYNNDKSRSYNLVSSFGRYRFGGWNQIESMPDRNILYIVGSSEYDGLRHKSSFDVKKIVRFPNGTEAFYLVSAP